MPELYCPVCSKPYDTPDGRCPNCMKPLGAAVPGALKTTTQQPVISRQREDLNRDDTLLQQRRAAETFRPRMRPPMLLLHVWDDDGADCQVIRVYRQRFVIGREEQDLVIPHDLSISRRHVELVREEAEGRWSWKLRDLQSSHGTFVRIQELSLHHGQILLMGGSRYQFRGVAQGGQLLDRDADSPKTIATFPVYRPETYRPMLVRLGAHGNEEEQMLIGEGTQWVGTAEDCPLRRSAEDDILLDPRHAKIEKKDRELWTIHDPGSTNGTWAMIQEEVISDSIEFQLGEQRFLARIP